MTTQTEKLTLNLHPVLADYLRGLVATGLYGADIETAARWIIADAVRTAIRNKELQQRWIPRSYQT